MGFNNLMFLAEEAVSLGDTMKKAGLNTLMGLGIVFLALAFIAIVIVIEGKIFTAINNKKAAPKVATEAPAVKVEAIEPEDVSDDEEIAAVITAAIYAFEAEAGEYVPEDGLVVRSIRRIGRCR